MASSGQPTKPIVAELTPPRKPAPTPVPSAGQRQAEAQLARDMARPFVPKGNRVTNGPPDRR